MNDERFVLIQVEPDPSVRVPLAGSVTLGRVDCDVTIDDPQVSRRHARIVVSGEGVTVEDIGSRNGTFVGDSRVDAAVALQVGASLRVGDTVWRLEGAPQAAEAQAAPAAAGTQVRAQSRGDVPAPPPPSGVHPAPPADAAVAPAFAASSPGRPVSAARRMEATLVCYAVIIATAAAVIAYLASR